MPADDIFAVAWGYVNNKSVAARIGHSAKLHSLRSAISSKGSAGSKAAALAGVAFRAAVSNIPVPVVGTLIGAIESKVEEKVRSWKHQRSSNAAADIGTRVKFELKELSVEELDRYRWKVSEAVGAYNKAAANFQADLTAKQAAQATCDAYLELAMAIQQVNRRTDILKQSILALGAAVSLTQRWVVACESGLAAPAATPHPATSAPAPTAAPGVTSGCNSARTNIQDAISAELANAQRAGDSLSGTNVTQVQRDEARASYILEKHGKCDRWCCFRNGSKKDDWSTFKDRAAFVVRNLAEPFGPSEFADATSSFF